MGTVHHITMIVTSIDEKKLSRTRNKALKLLDKKNITEIIGEGINGHKSFVIVPNGSQLDWPQDQEHRDGIVKLQEWIDESMPYDDGSTSVKYVITEYGENGLQSTDQAGNELNSYNKVDLGGLTEEQIEEAALKSAANHGAPRDVWIEGYGQVLKDGKVTPSGIEWRKTMMPELIYKGKPK